MPRRPERRPGARRRLASSAILLAGALAAVSGCGKADLASTSSSTKTTVSVATTPRATVPRAPAPPAAHSQPAVPEPLALTAARASAFARAVTLTAADVPGAQTVAREKTPATREREAAQCGGRSAPAIGGGRSPELQRGHGLDRESVSSSVEVLHDAKTVERTLQAAPTSAGLGCYERVLSRSLHSEADPNIRLLGVKVAPLGESIVGTGQAHGIRILARVGVPGAGVVVPLYVDALSIGYGPAEIDLYATSFVQPVAQRTEQELLALLHERAIRQRL
jgi:hypothetical protein